MDHIIFNHHIDKHKLADLAMLGKMVTLKLPEADERRIKLEEDIITLEGLIAQAHPSLNDIQLCIKTLDEILLHTAAETNLPLTAH